MDDLDAIERWLDALVADAGFLDRVGQRAEDRRNIVVDVLARLQREDRRRWRLFEDARHGAPQLAEQAWLTIVAKRSALDYLRGEQTVAEPADPEVGVVELMRRAASAFVEPQLSALELWAQGAEYADIARELRWEGGGAAVQQLVHAAIDTLRDARTGECPDLVVFESPSGASEPHLSRCASCRHVAELFGARSRAIARRTHRDDCARVEIQLALRAAGSAGATDDQLVAHERACVSCMALAAALFSNARTGEPTLRSVMPGAYALGREVARGGMGRIFEATDTRVGRRVAVKELVARTSVAASRFELEARVTARLQHPGIVPIYEIGRWPDGTPFYAMRMIDGRTLRETIADRKAIEDRIALLPVVIAAADAIAFAHAKRVIHRDVTPNNVIVGAHGDTVVIDWGLAKDLSSTSDDRGELVEGERAGGAELTRAGSVVGTAAYMPPEQAIGKRVDERADVYALGAILYHLLAGTPPYRGGSSDEILAAVISGPPTPVSEVAPGAPFDLVTIVSKAMAYAAADRYATARELADDLKRFQTGQLVGSHRYSPLQLARRWVRRHRATVAVAASLLAVLIAVLVVTVRRIVRERENAEDQQHQAESQRARAEEEATHARQAEQRSREELDELKAEQTARERAESEALTKGHEAQMSKEQLQLALERAERERARAEEERAVAERESQLARGAEQRAQEALAAEKKAREQAERLQAQDLARLRALEAAPAHGITNELRK